MAGFRIICGKCFSDMVLEKIGHKQLDWVADRIKYGEGIERKCMHCSNQDFNIFKTWLQ